MIQGQGVRVRVFYPDLKRLFDSPDDIRVEGDTVGACLDDLVKRQPEAGSLLFDSRGELLKRVYVFVNAEGMYKADLAKPVNSKDELILAILAAGG